MDKKYQVFVSSTYKDLIEERQEVMHALLELDCIPSGMELFPAADEAQWEVIKQVIDECDYYILIVGGRYGSISYEGISYTEMEYNYAIAQNKPVIAFIYSNIDELAGSKLEKSDEGRKRLDDFRNRVQQKLCKFWKSPPDLAAVVSRSLVKLMKKKPAIGWVRADEIYNKNNDTERLDLLKRVAELEELTKVIQSKSFKVIQEDFLEVSSNNFAIKNNLLRPENKIVNNQSTKAMLYEQHFIDELKNRADLVRIIEPYAPLKKKGANWMGCCPFHQEKTPSFSVNPSKGFYKCFGCGKGGSAFNFVMEIEGLNFPEAIKRIAEISGIPLPEPIDDKKYEQSKKRREEKKEIADQVIELNKYALDFWENHLQENNTHARAAREYLEKREISKETQKAFHIGFAPDSWDAIMSLLKEKGADEKLIEMSGLVSINDEKKRVYDRFRGRIMFPVLDVKGNPIAFGARILATGEPKYLNSPETPAYIKGEHLYGLFQSKEEIRQKKFAILVEGYLDLIVLYQYGIKNVAASLGTAFTPEQSKLLGRFARRVVINYDGDKAGVKAARRAIETLIKEDFETKVLVLPDGQDPDDFLRANGTESYNNLRGHAFPFLQFVLENLGRERNLASPKEKAEAIEDLMPVLSAIKNPIQKRDAFDQTMSYLRVEDAILKRDLWKTVKLGTKFEAQTVKQQVARATQARMTVAEQHLLELIIYDQELRDIILPQIEETDYETLATAEVFRALLALKEIGTDVTGENLLELVSDDAAASDFVPVLMMSEPAREKDDAIDEVLREAEGCLITLRSMAISRRILEISQEMVFAEQNGDFALRDSLVVEQIDLARLKHQLENKKIED